MHILHLYKDYYPVVGGIENHIRMQAEGAVAAGHQVTVLVTSLEAQNEEVVLNGVRIIKAARLATIASAPLSLALPRELRRQAPDIAHLHFPYPVTEVANWLLGRARRTVVTYHSDVVRQQGILRLYAPLMRRILGAADRIIATSPPYIESSAVLRPLAHRCVVIPLGIPTATFATAEPERVAALRAAWQGPGSTESGPPLLLFVGKHRYYKGLDELIRALPQIPGARLVAVGDGPMREEWQALVNQFGLTERVVFAGELPDEMLPAAYHAARESGGLFVLPANARSEAFGAVILEALAAGLPAVTTDLGTGTSWVNRHQETGLVVPPRDPAALAGALNTLLNDAALRQRYSAAAQARARAEFDQATMVERTLALYRELL
jgi:glycosyltransferase involved in cell wall biosynthesis